MLVWFSLERTPPMRQTDMRHELAVHDLGSSISRNPRCARPSPSASCILFAFIGTFTYVNFVLVREPLSAQQMALGFVYFVFLPSIVTTPLAGRVVARFGTRPTLWASLGRRRQPACRCC